MYLSAMVTLVLVQGRIWIMGVEDVL